MSCSTTWTGKRMTRLCSATARLTASDPSAIGNLMVSGIVQNITANADGVGVRGYRYAYPTFAQEGDRWVDAERGTGVAGDATSNTVGALVLVTL